MVSVPSFSSEKEDTVIAPVTAFDYSLIPKDEVACACCGSRDSREAFVGDRHSLGIRTVVCTGCGAYSSRIRDPDDSWFFALLSIRLSKVFMNRC